MISAFDLFKIGIGPSSSHTMGPMIAAHRFREAIANGIPECAHVQVKLYGSLAWTGVGHGTDRAVCLGLMGETPEHIDPDSVAVKVAELSTRREILLRASRRVWFDPGSDIIFEKKKRLPGHSNALSFLARRCDGSVVCTDNYYSIGGGFVLREGETVQQLKSIPPCPFASAKELLELCETAGGSIADVQRSNERVLRSDSEIDAALDAIRDAMFASINRASRLMAFCQAD